MIIGTAGHIDHGKTALVRALTGVETDRLKEEKARGITIEPGFAYRTLPGGARLGFADVPGHERFVHTMLAGAGGIDLALLVVAADDGIMPQTREHLAIVDLLGIRRGIIALTKADLADAARLATPGAEVGALTRGTVMEGAPFCRSRPSPAPAWQSWRRRLRPKPGRLRPATPKGGASGWPSTAASSSMARGRW